MRRGDEGKWKTKCEQLEERIKQLEEELKQLATAKNDALLKVTNKTKTQGTEKKLNEEKDSATFEQQKPYGDKLLGNKNKMEKTTVVPIFSVGATCRVENIFFGKARPVPGQTTVSIFYVGKKRKKRKRCCTAFFYEGRTADSFVFPYKFCIY